MPTHPPSTATDPFPMHTRPPRPPVNYRAQFLFLAACIAVALLVACAARMQDPHEVPPRPNADQDKSLIVGETAPDFTLPDAHGGTVTLSKIAPEKFTVIVFYLGYDCPHCVRHLKDLSLRRDEFDKLHAQIVAISPDSPDFTRNSIHDFGDFHFPLLSDPHKQTAADYGVLLGHDTLFHGLFIVDKHRKIRFALRSDHPFENTDELLKKLADLQDLP